MGSKPDHKQPVSTVTVDLQLKSGQNTLANAAATGAGSSGNTTGATAMTAVHPLPAANGEMNASSNAVAPPPPPAVKPTRSPHPNNALLSNTTSKPAYPGAKHDVRGFCIRHPRCRMVRPLSGEEGGSDPNNYRTVRKICPSCGEQSLVKKERKQPSHGFNPYAARERDDGEKNDKTNARGGGDGKLFTKVVPKTKSQAGKSPHFRKRLHRASSAGVLGGTAAVETNEANGKEKTQNESKAQNETERQKSSEVGRINSPLRSSHNNSGNHRINFKIDSPKDGVKQELSRQKSQSAIRHDEHNKDGAGKQDRKEGMQRHKSQILQQDKQERREEFSRQKSQSARQEEERGFKLDAKEELTQKGQSALRQEEEKETKDDVQRHKSQSGSHESSDDVPRQKSQSACRQEERKDEEHGDRAVRQKKKNELRRQKSHVVIRQEERKDDQHGDRVERQDKRDELRRQKSQCVVRQQGEEHAEGGVRQDKKDEAQRQREKGGTRQAKNHDLSRQKSQVGIRHEEKKDDEQKEGGTSEGTRDELKRQKSRDAPLCEEKIDRENKVKSQSEDHHQACRKGKISSKNAQHNTVSSSSQGDDLETDSIPVKSSADSKEKTHSTVTENKESKVNSKGAASPSEDHKRSSKEHNRKSLKLPVEKSQVVTKSVKSSGNFVKKKVLPKHDSSSNKIEVNREALDRISEKKDKHTVKIVSGSLDSKIAQKVRSRSLSPHRQMSRKATFVGAKEVDENDNRPSLKQRSKSVGHQLSRSQRQRLGSEFHYIHRPSTNPAPVAAISTYRMEFYDEIEARSCVKSLANI